MKLGLRFKFLSLFIAVLLLFSFVTIYSYLRLGQLQEEAGGIGMRFNEFSTVLAIGVDILDATRPIHLYPVTGEPSNKQIFAEGMDAASAKLRKVHKTFVHEINGKTKHDIAEEKLFNDFEDKLANARAKAALLFAITNPQNNPKAERLSDEVDNELHMAVHLINEYKQVESAEIAESMEKAETVALGRRNLLIVLMVIMGLTISSMIVINFRIINPILMINRAVEVISRGNFDQRLHIRTGDEIEKLAEAFNQMAFNLWQEEETAAEIQRRLLPQKEVKPPGVRLHARQVQAKVVGGDWYDFYQLEEEHLKLLIADASGKGMPGALLSTVAMSIIRSEPKSTGMMEILKKASRTVESRLGGGNFITLFSAGVNLENWEMSYINCGHEPPLLYDPDSRSWQPLQCHSGLPLGVNAEDFSPGTGIIPLKKGNKIIFYTDGLHVVKNKVNQLFTIDDVIVWLKKHEGLSIEPMIDGLMDEALRFCRHRLLDDVTLLGFEVISQKSLTKLLPSSRTIGTILL